MKEAWKNLDLDGGGLQRVNLHITQHQKRRLKAYAFWLLFPLGAHRIYLNTSVTGLIYAGLSATSVILWISVGNWALVPFMAELALALFDLYWIDKRVSSINKAIRMSLYLGGGAAPAPGYRGRFNEDIEELLDDYQRIKESEKAGIQPAGSDADMHFKHNRTPSFAEQEAMLRHMAKRRRSRTANQKP